MKSTKILLSTAIALIIALCVSVQITAMKMDQKVNPYLNEKHKNAIKRRLCFFIKQNETSCDPKNRLAYDPKYCSAVAKKISQLEAIYYDDKPYPDTEIENVVYEFSLD